MVSVQLDCFFYGIQLYILKHFKSELNTESADQIIELTRSKLSIREYFYINLSIPI
jgi:hypothetical protein